MTGALLELCENKLSAIQGIETNRRGTKINVKQANISNTVNT